MLSFHSANPADFDLAVNIARRAAAMDPADRQDRMAWVMDILGCHCSGCPLKLAELLAADDSNFGHDVFGINRFINRDTGELEDSFLPRFAAKQVS